MSRPGKAPHSARVLTQWVDAYAREWGLGRKRVRDWVSYMVVGGQLERANSAAGGPRFTIKGAVALEMRLPTTARATRDIDLVVDDAEGQDVARILDDALAGSYQDFTFRVKGEPLSCPTARSAWMSSFTTEARAGAPSRLDRTPEPTYMNATLNLPGSDRPDRRGPSAARWLVCSSPARRVR